MSTHNGRRAEVAAAEYLKERGLNIESLNWKNRFCEIDIVASKTVRRYFRATTSYFFIEVKYRSNHSQGDGLDYITPRKIKQMQFAAKNWISENKSDSDYRLLAIAVTGKDFGIERVESIN